MNFRSQLGLPTGRPIIMTGHQAAFWHPGILAKYLAADAIARTRCGSAAWLVVDQDDPPANTIVAYPVLGPGGVLRRATWDVAAGAPVRPSGIDFVDAGLARIADAWAAHADATPARRVAAALADLMSPLIPPAPTIFATDLCRTQLFGVFVETMAANPETCALAYNAAAAAHPSAGIRPLLADPVQDRFELPLWSMRDATVRERDDAPTGTLPHGRVSYRNRVYAEDLPRTPRDVLAPRALLMTAMMRLAGCDLFIHGTGGGGDGAHEGYDRVTEAWLAAWRPKGFEGNLAPVRTVTATRLLPLPGGEAPSTGDVAVASWRAHRARHDPALLGDHAAAAEKSALLDRIAAAPRRSAARREAFLQMHAALERSRHAHADAMHRFDEDAARARALAGNADILADRTWAFPLYPPSMLERLRDEIAAGPQSGP